jgi:hypothetical protein
MVAREVWGPVTWTFFHTLAAKVKPESFPAMRAELFELIRTACQNIPCPICQEHAGAYMTHVYWNKIVTKDDLALMLWEFHNIVNKRLGVAQMPYEDCAARYSRANPPVVFATYANISSQSSVGAVSTMVSKIRRRGVAHRAWDYLAAHKDDFAP